MTRRRSIALEAWELRDFDPGAGDKGAPGWIPVRAPGDTYQALIEAGRLEHPFQARGEDAAAWVRDREWWWRTTFEAPAWTADETVELVFEGLDTFAHVYLDGVLLARTDNMFRRHVFEVDEHLRPGATHRLAIRFDPPALAVQPVDLPVWSAFTDRVSRSKRNLMRKAQFGWGWDWGPDLPTVGVWRPASVQVRPRGVIADVRMTTTAISAGKAEAVVAFELEPFTEAGTRTLEITVTDPQGLVVLEHVQPAASGTVIAAIERPQLWWTADLGDQPLYDLTVRLKAGGDILDEAHRRVGLRTIALDQSPDPDDPGASFFRFVLNGVPIFAKGACWVPASSFVGDVDESAYRRLIGQAVRANMNMIRVWGGGTYEPDLFYDLCDEQGVLVWQDFMFACAHYPEGADFVASVRAEVEDQVRRLRHHPSLALWCGNNEIQAMHRINADLSGETIPLSGAVLYEEEIPNLLARLDPGALYRPSSPFGGASPNGMRAGDVHDWTVWHGVPPIPDDVMTEPFASTPEGVAYTRYADDHARFVSEFGIQAAPALATLKRWVDPADLALDSEGFLARIKDEARKADAMMIPVTGLPNSVEQYVDFTQWTQAEGLKFGIEHFRRRRPQCSGALLWQLNDCWPCVSWSLVDFDGAEKAGYHAVRRAFAPVLASFKAGDDGAVALWITNDTLTTIEGEAVVTLEALDGVVWRETVTYVAPAGGHAQPWSKTAVTGGLALRVVSPHGGFEANRHLIQPIKDLDLADGAAPSMAARRVTLSALEATITATRYTPFVHLISDRADIRFSDNHFDLVAGESRVVRVSAMSAIGEEDISLGGWVG